MTDEEMSRYAVLKLANENGKFALEVGSVLRAQVQIEFEQMLISGWVRLIDVTPIAEYPKRLFRVFIVSADAMAWFRS